MAVQKKVWQKKSEVKASSKMVKRVLKASGKNTGSIFASKTKDQILERVYEKALMTLSKL